VAMHQRLLRHVEASQERAAWILKRPNVRGEPDHPDSVERETIHQIEHVHLRLAVKNLIHLRHACGDACPDVRLERIHCEQAAGYFPLVHPLFAINIEDSVAKHIKERFEWQRLHPKAHKLQPRSNSQPFLNLES